MRCLYNNIQIYLRNKHLNNTLFHLAKCYFEMIMH